MNIEEFQLIRDKEIPFNTAISKFIYQEKIQNHISVVWSEVFQKAKTFISKDEFDTFQRYLNKAGEEEYQNLTLTIPLFAEGFVQEDTDDTTDDFLMFLLMERVKDFVDVEWLKEVSYEELMENLFRVFTEIILVANVFYLSDNIVEFSVNSISIYPKDLLFYCVQEDGESVRFSFHSSFDDVDYYDTSESDLQKNVIKVRKELYGILMFLYGIGIEPPHFITLFPLTYQENSTMSLTAYSEKSFYRTLFFLERLFDFFSWLVTDCYKETNFYGEVL